MNWMWRVIIIVPAASKSAAEQAARQINSTGPDYVGDAFTTPLSADGNNPPTHWSLYTSATDEMLAAMASVLPSIAGVRFWRHGTDGVLAASNVTQPNGQQWGWEQSLKAARLEQVETSV